MSEQPVQDQGQTDGQPDVQTEQYQSGQSESDSAAQAASRIPLTSGDTQLTDDPGTPIAEADLPGELGTISRALDSNGCALVCYQVLDGPIKCELQCVDNPLAGTGFEERWLLDEFRRERIGIPRQLRTDQDPKLEAAINRARNLYQKRRELADAAVDLLQVSTPVEFSAKTVEGLEQIVKKLKAELGEMSLLAELFASAATGLPVETYRGTPNLPTEPDEAELQYAAYKFTRLKGETRDFIHEMAADFLNASTTPPKEQFLWRTLERVTRRPST